MGKPDFLLIGETKCGTTSLYNYLIQHPDILQTHGNGEAYDKSYASKELRFFDKFYEKGIDWYKSCFPETAKNQITGEGTPMYMYRTLVAQRVARHFPAIKLIVLLRNPVDRLISNYQHNWKWVPGWKETYPTLESYFYGCADRDYYQIEKSIYYYSLMRWYDHFDRDQFHIMKSENMYEHPEETYAGLIDFLGVSKYKPSAFPIYRANEYEDINAELRKELEDFYRPYNAKLEKLTGIKFNWYA